jgi:xanthine/uracil permease
MTHAIAIILGTLGPTIVSWIGYRENQRDKVWVPTYIFFSLLGLVWGGIAIYNRINHTLLGSIPRIIGVFVTGTLCGICIALVLTHLKSRKTNEGRPPNQAL